ncbi:MAG: XRE family transcriptional regulator [Nitrospinae bacterium]|nr:XRE family transcriptional regulator [Nitrospinota bacterium]
MKRTTAGELSEMFGIRNSRALEAILKADIIKAVLKEMERKGITHAGLAKRSGLARSTVTGILSGSLQKITLDRTLRLLEGAGLTAKLQVIRAKQKAA